MVIPGPSPLTGLRERDRERERVYCASANGTTGGVYRSLDNGGTWTNIVNGLPSAEADEVHLHDERGCVRALG